MVEDDADALGGNLIQPLCNGGRPKRATNG